MITRRTNLISVITALAVLFCLTFRLLYVASHLETGFSTLTTDWRNSTLSWLLGPYIPIAERPPAKQADFWLAETDRILREHPNDARLAMAAALVLDSPGRGYERSHLQAIRLISGRIFPEMDWQAIQQAADEFENRCHLRCLELAAKATALEADNVDWWRLRAILLLRGGYERRDPDCLQLLDEFSTHDPNNALYDYLAADKLWTQSTKWVNENDKLELHTLDTASFDEGTRRFDNAQTKPFLAIGDAGFTATAELLHLANIARTDHPDIVNGREIHFRRSYLILNLSRAQFKCAEQKLNDGDIPAALALRRESLHLIDQHTAVGQSTAYESSPKLWIRKTTANWMHEIASKHPDAITAMDADEIKAFRNDALVEERVYLRAAQTLPQKKQPPRRGPTFPGVTTSISEILIALTPQTAAILVLIASATAILMRWTGFSDVTLGPVGQLAAFLIAAAATTTLFGIAPAGIIPRELQYWLCTIAMVVLPFAFLCYLGWQFLRKYSFQFSLRALLTATLIVSIVFAIAVSPLGRSLLEDLPFQFAIPPRNLGSTDANSFEEWFTSQGARAWWAVTQWISYSGNLLTIALWAALVAAFLNWKLQRLIRRNLLLASALTIRCRIASLLTSLTRPALAASAALFLLYLVLVPHHLQQIDRRFQQDMSFARDPDAYWQSVATAVQSIRSNPELMAEIQASVDSMP